MRGKIFLVILGILFLFSLFIVFRSHFSSIKVVDTTRVPISSVDSFINQFGHYAFESFNLDTIKSMTTEGSYARIQKQIEVAGRNARDANVSTTFRLDSLRVMSKDSYEAFFTVLLLKDSREVSGDVDSIVSNRLRFKEKYSEYTNSITGDDKESFSSEFLVTREMVSSLKFSLMRSTSDKNIYIYGYKMLINQ